MSNKVNRKREKMVTYMFRYGGRDTRIQEVTKISMRRVKKAIKKVGSK